ncbi:OLC1v1010947C1 [Oldenlandia corymbosa var. corymbosa]|uniref:OLC1v1010947C1 n=1 Tax=Oldenlandia corymbosa var. corymbosa TaxID=529605 RepID=A0AAV1DUW4_OLDCO|nr:OLC1v1010947C1 [Oldenlandia corymbosa var. corymbosa]
MHALLGGFLRSPQFKAQITRETRSAVQRALASWRITDLDQQQPQPVYVQDESKKIAFEVIVRTLMSIGPGEDLNFLRREFEEYIKGFISLPIKLPGTRLYKSLKAKGRMIKVIRSIIEQRKISIEKENNKRSSSSEEGSTSIPKDIIDVLLRDTLESSADETQPRLPLDSISENIIEMMIPGEETVPTSLTLAVKFLSDSPLILARLLEENMELKKRKEQSGDEYDWTDYVSLPFTQNVISETLRMGNIVNAVWREAVKDVTIKGHFIPKGWCVLASFSSIHMDEANYENPYEFNPHRWEKSGANVNSNKFTPFGGGQRLCPGLELSRLEIAISLHHLVTTYSWVAEDDDITYFPFVRLRRKLPITITPLVGAI